MTDARGPIGIGAKLTALGLALVLAFGLCEVAARIVYPAPPEPVREPQLLYQSDADLGFVHLPNQKGYLDDGLATINALGLRGALPELPKPAGSLRVLAIGDSTTFGWGVGDDEAYPARLEQLLRARFPERRPEVVNGGVGAFDLDQAAALLERFAPVLEPDMVLVGTYWNDLPYDGVSPDGVPVARRDGTPGRAAASRPAARAFRIGNNPSRLNRILRRSRVLYVLRHEVLAAVAPSAAAANQVQWEMAVLAGRSSPAIDRAWAALADTMARIRRLGEAGGFTVGVLILPIRAQVEDRYPQAAYQTRMRQIAEAQGFVVIDPLERFVGASDRGSLFIPYDRMHFSAQGNVLLARSVFEAIERIEGR